MATESLSTRAIIGRFYLALETAEQPWVGNVSTLFTSDQASETYAFLGMTPTMREWIGGRLAHGVRENGITIFNKHFEATLRVMADELRRDQTGQIDMRLRELAIRSAGHWASLLVELLHAGETTACYDGLPFFDTGHTEAAAPPQSNIVDLTVLDPTAPTFDDMLAGIWEGITRLRGVLDTWGEPLQPDLQRFQVLIPTRFWKSTLGAFAPTLHPEGARFAPFGDLAVEFAHTPRLDWTDRFAVFAVDKTGVSAVIRQTEMEPNLSAQAEGSAHAFQNDEYLFGVHAIRGVGYGLWQRCALVRLT